jgi:hypothetical protein
MNEPFPLTDDERHFLRHWTYEASCPFWGPASIWCRNHRVSPAHGPYPMAELYWAQELEAGREGWIFDRPSISFRVPWPDAAQFRLRADAALAQIPCLQGRSRFTRSEGIWHVEGTLTPEESDYLRAYNREMVESGSGYHIDLAHQHGVCSHHLIPFFILLDDLYGQASRIATYPWTDFPARYGELSGRKYDYPDWALTPR